MGKQGGRKCFYTHKQKSKTRKTKGKFKGNIHIEISRKLCLFFNHYLLHKHLKKPFVDMLGMV